MRQFSIHPAEMFALLLRNRGLILASAKREILARYKGSVLGLFWSFVNPLLMLAVYTFVFSVVFKARWGTSGDQSRTEFALLLFAGLIFYSLFAECVNRAPSLILSNTNYVKKVIFPLEILPVVAFLSTLFHTIISLIVWLVAYLLFFGIPHPTILYLPLILLPFYFLITGLSWALAAFGVYLRDISQVVSVITTILMFLTPIFYPLEAIPEPYRQIICLNPLASMIEQVRAVLFWGHAPYVHNLVILFIGSLIVYWLGFAWFQMTRKGFADVI